MTENQKALFDAHCDNPRCRWCGTLTFLFDREFCDPATWFAPTRACAYRQAGRKIVNAPDGQRLIEIVTTTFVQCRHCSVDRGLHAKRVKMSGKQYADHAVRRIGFARLKVNTSAGV